MEYREAKYLKISQLCPTVFEVALYLLGVVLDPPTLSPDSDQSIQSLNIIDKYGIV